MTVAVKRSPKMPKKGALTRDLWVIVTCKALFLVLLWGVFCYPAEVPVNNATLTAHVAGMK
jgi:hypothetical protein